MHLRRLDDYQGWQVCHAGSSIVIDPWLVDEPIGGAFDRMYTGSVSVEDVLSGSDAAVAVALCTSVNDHARPLTLAALSHLPVLGPAAATRVARHAGATHTRTMRRGDVAAFPCRQGGHLVITATRTGLPLGLIAVGYAIDARDEAGALVGRVWIEPHQPLPSVARSLAPVDIALLPAESVTALVLPVTAGLATSQRAAAAAQAAILVPTATDPGRDMTGWQRAVYRVRPRVGSIGVLNHMSPGEAIDIAVGS